MTLSLTSRLKKLFHPQLVREFRIRRGSNPASVVTVSEAQPLTCGPSALEVFFVPHGDWNEVCFWFLDFRGLLPIILRTPETQ